MVIRKTTATSRLLILAIAGATAPALSQPREDDGRTSSRVAADVEEVVVTAQRRDERLQDVPIAMSVLGGDALDKSSYRGVTEVLNSIPGISTNENYLGGGTTVTVRGVTASAPTLTGASTIAYYLDEVPFGLLRTAIAPDSNAYDLERVEVLRGPQGTLFGSSALNGVVRVLTKDADLSGLETKVRASGSGTSEGSTNYRVDGVVNVPLIEDKLAVRAVVGYQDDSGWVDSLAREDINDRQVQTYRLKIGAQPAEPLTFDLSAWSSRSESGAPSFGHVFDKTRTTMDQPIETNYDAYGAHIAYEFPAFTLVSSSGYLDYYNFGNLALDVPGFGFPDTAFIQSIGSHVFSEEISLNSASSAPWRWSAGAMYRRGTERMHQHYTGAFAVIPVLNYYNLSESYAVFGELTRVFGDGRWEITGGARYFTDEESQKHQTGIGAPVNQAETTAHATTPRVVLAWHPSDGVMTYASYAQGFRSGFPPTDAVLVLNPDFPAVKPDRLHNYEIGSKGRLLGGALAYDAAVYYIKWDDIQQQIGVPFTGSGNLSFFPAQINGEAASGAGADLSITVQPANGLNLSAYVGWNDLQMDGQIFSNGAILFDEGDRLNGSPEYTAGASVAYTFPMNGSGYEGTVFVSTNYTSEQSYRGIGFPGVSEGDEIQTARLTFTVASPHHWSLMAFVDNLTDERGTPTVTFVGIEDWSARLRPRTIGVQVEYDFGRQ